jgi:predicted nucleotidyltransferase
MDKQQVYADLDSFVARTPAPPELKGWNSVDLVRALMGVHQDKMDDLYASYLKRFALIIQYGRTIVSVKDNRNPNYLAVIIFGEKLSDIDNCVVSIITNIPEEHIGYVTIDMNPGEENWRQVFGVSSKLGVKEIKRFLSAELRLKLI